MDLQACMRGFSFMPRKKTEIMDLKYVEKDALEQTWKATRRQRLKQQEQKIWDQFVQEQDIVRNVCKDDPYQFLHQLPESCIKELLEEELQKMRKEQIAEKQDEQQAETEQAPAVEADNQHVVTFVEDDDRQDMFHIFDDEISGPEEEILNDSVGSPPCTVRERYSARCNRSPTKSVSPDKASSKSSENVANMIESSIYCAKVKDLRIKINDEILEIIATLERQDLTKIEPEEVPKLLKRSTEFCARFNRIYLYQLHRQVHEVERASAMALPLARHTHFQSQMVRIVSLHQNLLQTAQIFHKSIPQTACIRDSGEVLRTLLRTTLEASDAGRSASPPPGLAAAQQLYNDNIQQSCEKLEVCLNEYTAKLSEYLDNVEHAGKPKSRKHKGKKRGSATWSKAGTKSGTDTDGRLSMYSLETLRLNLNSKSTISRGISSGTSKVRGGLAVSRKQKEKREHSKSPRKSPKSRRPLMRDPAAGKPRRKKNRELDVPTLVETVGVCASSHMSREDSPHQTPRDSNPPTPRRDRDTKKESSKKLHVHTPRKKRKSPRSAKKFNSPVKRGEEDKDQVKPDKKEHKDQGKPDKKEHKDQVKPDKKEDIKVDKNSECQKPIPHDVKVEIKPKSPDKIIESTLRAVKDHLDSARAQANDSSAELKPVCESPKVKSQNTVETKIASQNCVPKVNREHASPRYKQDGNTSGRRSDRDKYKIMEVPGSCEVSRVLRQLCGGDVLGSKNDKVSGARNAQLLCINSSNSPRQPSTPQLLRILEETIQKKAPKPLCPKPITSRDAEKLRLTFNISEKTTENLFQYRTKFVQHMLTSSMYANSAIGKPWEMIGSISDKIIDELLLGCAKEMELKDVMQELYASETR